MRRAVIGIIFNTDKNQVVMIKRRDVPVWVLPGGGIDFAESPEKAVIREVYEETGLKVHVERLVGEYSPINKLSRHTYVFECIPIQGILCVGPETREIGFYPIQELPKPFFFLHQDWLKDAIKMDPEVIKRPISNITYIELLKFFFKHPILVLRAFLSRLGYPINSRSAR